MPTFPTKSLRSQKKSRKTKKATKISVLRSWGILRPIWLRYKNPIEKGIYWYYFSKFIRARDIATFGTCISCGRSITMETSDCGHFIPAGECGPDLLFDPRNNNAECSHCNAWDGLHLFGYAKNLDLRYGVGTAEELLRRHRAHKTTKPAPKDFPRKEYEALIKTCPSYKPV